MAGSRRALVALALLMALLGTGSSWAVAGDSVTYDARDEIAARDGYVRAFGGIDIRTGRPALRLLRHRGYETVVVALGLNDVSYRTALPEIRRRVRAAMREDLAGVDCVLWVDLKTTSNVHRNWPRRAGQFNTLLAELVPQLGGRVLRWSSVARQHRSWFRADGLHLRVAGQTGYARWLRDRVRHFC